MGELERQIPEEIANIVSGEIVRTSDIPAMAAYLRDLRDHDQQIRALKLLIEEVILAAAKAAGTKTLHLENGLEAKVTGGPKLVWDVEKLQQLEQAGLPPDRMDELIKETVEYKVNTTVAGSIERSGNEEYARIVKEARSYEPAPQRIAVTRA